MAVPLWLPKLIKKAFPYRHKIARLSRYPVVADLLDKTILNGDDLIYLPKDRVVIGQAIEQPGSTVLPSAILDHFIEKASYRWIMNECICRAGEGCTDYPQDLGCLFLGDAVLQINPKMGRMVTKEEALAHAQRARELGLVHLIGRDRIDNLWLAAGPFGRLLTVCACCPCCCLFKILPDLDARNSAKVTAMPGVQVTVNTDACTGCGKCAREGCFVDAIHMVDGKAQISADCRGCGRCTEVCPRKAISLTITDMGYVNTQIERISSLVDVTSPRQAEVGALTTDF
jgi:ferredoxin